MIKRFLAYLAFVSIVLFFAGSSDHPGGYVSPEHIFFSAENQEIYVGYATSPEIAVLTPKDDKLDCLIKLPSPVNGLCARGDMLYASMKDNESRIAVIDIKRRKFLKSIQVGYSPCDIEASGNHLFVANRFSNDVSVVDHRKQKEIERIRVVREPSALSVSPKGKILAVANSLPSGSSTDDYISACVSMIDVEQLKVIKHIDLPNGSFALNDIIFSNDGEFIYVTHQVGRYNVLTNQIEKGWINTNAISIIDANTLEWYNTVLLDDLYKGAANPGGLNISDDGKWLYAAISGTHELFVIDRKEMHSRMEKSRREDRITQTTSMVNQPAGSIEVPIYKDPADIDSMHVLFEDIPRELGFLASFRKRVQLQGNGARQLAVVPTENGHKVYIPGFYSEGIDVIEIEAGKISNEYIQLNISDPGNDPVRYGDMIFHDASYCFQQWQSCASCHPGDGRADGLNWDLMNDGIGNPKNTKSLLYSHQTPPAMITGIRSDAETAVRSGYKYIQFHNISEEKAVAVDAYLRALKPVPSPYLIDRKLSEKAERGKLVFESLGCGYCHANAYHTDMQKHRIGDDIEFEKGWDTPTLIEVWRTAPYLFDGRAATMKDVYAVHKHGINKELTDIEIDELVAFVNSL